MKFEIRHLRRAFTLIEMMVVIAIIGIIIGVSVAVYGRVTKKAQQARGRELVSNVATALSELLQREKRWPPALLDAAQNADGGRLDADVARCFVMQRRTVGWKSLISLNYDWQSDNLVGIDRCGIVTPWAADVLKRLDQTKSGLDIRVPSGGVVWDHQLHFAVDTEGNGFVDVRLNTESRVRVRASVAVWCWGMNGREDNYRKSMAGEGEADDIYSWTRAQEVK